MYNICLQSVFKAKYQTCKYLIIVLRCSTGIIVLNREGVVCIWLLWTNCRVCSSHRVDWLRSIWQLRRIKWVLPRSSPETEPTSTSRPKYEAARPHFNAKWFRVISHSAEKKIYFRNPRVCSAVGIHPANRSVSLWECQDGQLPASERSHCQCQD